MALFDYVACSGANDIKPFSFSFHFSHFWEISHSNSSFDMKSLLILIPFIYADLFYSFI